MLAVDVLIVAPIAVGIYLAPGVLELTMLFTELPWAMAATSAIIAANAYGIKLIVDGAMGR